jgi:hypothetical protein
MNTQVYSSMNELRKAHPAVKNWAYIFTIPRGMSDEAARNALKKRLEQKGESYSMIYQIGNFFVAPARNTPKLLCVCLDYIGDHGPCPIHGDPLERGATS